MKPLRDHLRIRKLIDGPMVRPFGLIGPILVLLIALPLLRPLRSPDPASLSNDETLRLATIRSLAEHHTLKLDLGYARIPGAIQHSNGVYSSQPPMLSALLSLPAWLMIRLGYSFEQNQLLLEYLLTMLGVTIPVALCAGLIYRMGRLFELKRPWRTTLGFVVVAGSGLLSYAVVLNPYAPAGCLVIGATACLVHLIASTRQQRRAGIFALAGALAALAATIEPAAAVLFPLLLLVIPAMRFTATRRAVGVVLYLLGALPVLGIHATLNRPITGDAVPASLHPLARISIAPAPPISTDGFADDSDDTASAGWFDSLTASIGWYVRAFVGEHGLLSHFPLEFVGALGIAAVMHRHWPSATKVLAAATGIGSVAILVIYRVIRPDWSSAMFASKWFIVFSPLLLFWAGAWLRRKHNAVAWTLAGIAMVFSVAVGLLGTIDPLPRHGFDRYTAWASLQKLVAQPRLPSGALAGRE